MSENGNVIEGQEPEGLRAIYLCGACHLGECEVIVPWRKPDEDVVHYVGQTVAGAIAAHHRSRSPWCLATKMAWVKVPVPKGSESIGFPVKH